MWKVTITDFERDILEKMIAGKGITCLDYGMSDADFEDVMSQIAEKTGINFTHQMIEVEAAKLSFRKS